MEGYNKKKLSAMVAVALGFGMAFGVAPAEVAQAANMTVQSQIKGAYTVTVDGVTTKDVSLTEMLNQFMKNAAEEGSTITMDADAATSLNTGEDGDTFTLGKGVTLNVTGTNSSASVKGGDTASEVKVNGTNVSGDNVDLASVDIKAGGNKRVSTALSGNIGSMTTSGTGVVTLSSGNLTVDTLDVKTVLTVSDEVTVAATNVTVSDGAELKTTSANSLKTETLTVSDGASIAKGSTINTSTLVVDGGTIASGTTVNTETLVINEGSTIASGTNVTASTIEVASTTDAINQLSNITVSSSDSSDSSSNVTITVKAADNATATEIEEAKATVNKVVASNESLKDTAKVTVESKINVTKDTNGTYTVGKTTGVAAKELSTAVANAYTAGSTTVVLDKDATKELSDGIAIPAGKTMIVSNTNSKGDTETVTVTAGKNDANVKIDDNTVSSVDGSKVSLSKIEVATSTTTVKALSDLDVDTVVVNSGNVSATNVESKNFTVNGGTVAAEGVNTDNLTVNSGSVGTTENGSITVTDSMTVNGGSVTVNNGSIDATGATLTVASGATVSTTGTGTVKADTLNVTGGTIKAASVTADEVKLTGESSVVTDTVEANKVTIESGTITAATSGKQVTVKADKVDISNTLDLSGLTLSNKTENTTLEITKNGSLLTTQEELDAIAASVSKGVTVTSGGLTATGTKTDSGDGDNTGDLTDKNKADIKSAIEYVKDLSDTTVPPQTALDEQIAENKKVNPFQKPISTAEDVANVSQKVSDYNTNIDDLKEKRTQIQSTYEAINDMDSAKVAEYLNEQGSELTTATELLNKLKTIDKQIENLSQLSNPDAVVKEYTAKLQDSVREAGKTLAAPSATGMRSATAISNALAGNVVKRTDDLRTLGFASATDDGGVEHAWFQISHSDMDVENGDVYGKSTVKLTNYQLGYDAQVGPHDYLGGFIGHTAGSADFTGTVNGSIDVKNSINYGVYGTHTLPAAQYIDYMVYGGRFDNKYSGSTWGTSSFGVMAGYGAKIASSASLTVNPYIQFAYDRISVDDVTFSSGNTVKSDTANNFGVKVGLNLISASGFYGGTAYSRGLSGDYRSTINGIGMPSSDNDTSVVYLNLGYRANITANTMLDLSVEKTFVDYDGWKATGKYNIYF